MTTQTDVQHLAKSLYASAAIDFDGNFGKAATRLIDQAQEIQRLEAANAKLRTAIEIMLKDYRAVHGIGDLEMQPALFQAGAAIAKHKGTS